MVLPVKCASPSFSLPYHKFSVIYAASWCVQIYWLENHIYPSNYKKLSQSLLQEESKQAKQTHPTTATPYLPENSSKRLIRVWKRDLLNHCTVKSLVCTIIDSFMLWPHHSNFHAFFKQHSFKIRFLCIRNSEKIKKKILRRTYVGPT